MHFSESITNLPHFFSPNPIRKIVKGLNIRGLYLLVAATIFIFLNFSHFGVPDDLDFMLYYKQSALFYEGGISALIKYRGGNLHPPMLSLFAYPFYFLLGVSSKTAHVVSFVIFMFSNGFFYSLLQKLFKKHLLSALSCFLFFFNPLVFVVHSGLMIEPLIILFTFASLYFAVCKDYAKMSFFLCGLVLCKLTSLVFIVAIVGFYIALKISKEKLHWKDMAPVLPVPVTFFVWTMVLWFYGAQHWKSNLYVKNKHGVFEVVVRNFLEGRVLNGFFYENLENLFLLNFNWVITLFFAMGLFLFVKNHSVKSQKGIFGLSILFTLFLYIVLTFHIQTFSIPRYSAPIVSALAFFAAYCVTQINAIKWRAMVFITLVGVYGVAMFSSTDPYTRKKYGTIQKEGQTVYNFPLWHKSGDAIVYNMQFRKIGRRLNGKVENVLAKKADYFITEDCWFLKMEEKISFFYRHPKVYPFFNKNFTNVYNCRDFSSFENNKNKENFTKKRVVIDPSCGDRCFDKKFDKSILVTLDN